MKAVDVLVVGAGPTGLMMAAELARYGLSFQIVDKKSGLCKESRAMAIQARTMEVFDHVGIIHRFLDEGIAIRAINPMRRDRPIGRIDFGMLDSEYPFVLSLEQSKTEAILLAHLAELKGNVQWETELVSFTQDSQRVEAVLRHLPSGKEERMYASWIVGCDGAHSCVRSAMNVSFQGKTFSDLYSLADVQVRWKYPHAELFAFPDAGGILAAFPMPGKHRYRLIFQLPRCRDLLSKKKALLPEELAAIAVPTLSEINATLRKYTATELEVSDARWITHFHINSRLASSYREGRLFLAGDAAHIHSPVGAQGMNTGLQDAFNLAWKLAFVKRKMAHEMLLDTYQIERHSFGKELLKRTERASRMVSLRNPWLASLRNQVLSWLLKSAAVRSKLIQIVSQTAIRYPQSSIVRRTKLFPGGPQAGERMPNAPLLHKGQPKDLYAVLRRKTAYSLLLFVQDRIELDWIHAIAGFGERPVDVYLITTSSSLEKIPGVETLLDPQGIAHAKCSAKMQSAYLIRPDFYIRERQAPIDLTKLGTYFLDKR